MIFRNGLLVDVHPCGNIKEVKTKEWAVLFNIARRFSSEIDSKY